jgi:hypothetical protein
MELGTLTPTYSTHKSIPTPNSYPPEFTRLALYNSLKTLASYRFTR